MRNLKRVLSLALALVMVLGMMVITTSAATFDDAEEITNVEAVEVMYALGIVQGNGTGSFDPDGSFNRAAAAKLLTLMLVKPAVADKLAGTCAFDDVNNDPAYAWAAPYVAYCSNLGYIVGNGDGTFNPGGELTDIELGKLVLCALGYDAAKYTGPNWSTAVTLDMIDAELVDAVTGKVVTREAACEMIRKAMVTSATPDTYVVKGVKFDNFNDAAMFAAMFDLKLEDIKTVKSDDYLLKTVYGVTFKGDDVDAYGRSIRTYTNAATKLNLSYANEEPIDASDLTGYTVATKELDTKEAVQDIVYVNGADATALSPAAGKTLADAIKALDTDTAEIEIFAEGKNIYKIVVVQYTYDYVEEVVEATKDKKAYVDFYFAGEVEELTGYEEGDYVAYAEVDEKLVNMVKLETYAGVMTSYTKDGKYTIGGKTFEVEGDLDLSGLLGEKDIVYVLGLTGKIIDAYVDAGDGKPAEVIKNYVKVTASLGKLTTATDEWTDKETTTAATAQVKGVLSDGTVGIWNLAVKQDAKTKAFYVEVDGEKVPVVKGDLGINGYYTYKMTEDGITLVSSDVPAWVNQTRIDEDTLAIDEIYLINADTTFIVTDAKGNVSVVESLDDIYVVGGDAVVFYDILWNTDKNGNKTEAARVATVVYADVQDVVEEADVAGVAYIDGNYTVAKVDEKTVYTYEGVTLKGEVIALTYSDVLRAGIYVYDEENVIDVEEDTKAVSGKVLGILDSVVNLEGVGYVPVADGVEPVLVGKDAKWEAGASISYFLNKDGAISGIYVGKAVEA